MSRSEGRLFARLSRQNRMRGDMNYRMWVRQILDGGFNFSYGSRIHGNLIALQQRIPAYVELISARTREICDFYKIPNSASMPFPKRRKRLFDLYLACDYGAFNSNYAEKYKRFVEFLDSRGLSHNVGESREFFDHLDKLEYYDWLSDENVAKLRERFAPRSFLGRLLAPLGF